MWLLTLFIQATYCDWGWNIIRFVFYYLLMDSNQAVVKILLRFINEHSRKKKMLSLVNTCSLLKSLFLDSKVESVHTVLITFMIIDTGSPQNGSVSPFDSV